MSDIMCKNCRFIFVIKWDDHLVVQQSSILIVRVMHGSCTVRVISRSLCSGDTSDQWKNVLDYWFSPGAEKKWFHGGAQVDEEIRNKFGSMVSESYI